MAGAIVFTASFVPIASHAKTHQTAENNSTTLLYCASTYATDNGSDKNQAVFSKTPRSA
jgi:hypothetical protein